MKYMTLLLSVLLISCANQEPMRGNITDTSVMRDEKPDGYPKTYIVELAKFPGHCVQTTEDWREDRVGGRIFWFKHTVSNSAPCPK